LKAIHQGQIHIHDDGVKASDQCGIEPPKSVGFVVGLKAVCFKTRNNKVSDLFFVF